MYYYGGGSCDGVLDMGDEKLEKYIAVPVATGRAVSVGTGRAVCRTVGEGTGRAVCRTVGVGTGRVVCRTVGVVEL